MTYGIGSHHPSSTSSSETNFQRILRFIPKQVFPYISWTITDLKLISRSDRVFSRTFICLFFVTKQSQLYWYLYSVESIYLDRPAELECWTERLPLPFVIPPAIHRSLVNCGRPLMAIYPFIDIDAWGGSFRICCFTRGKGKARLSPRPPYRTNSGLHRKSPIIRSPRISSFN